MKHLFVFLLIILNANLAFAYHTEDIQNGCGTYADKMWSAFEPYEYTCDAGEFLPADTLGCRTCPTDAICSGGTYSFNDNEYQGVTISATYITHNLTNMCSVGYADFGAKFEINTYTCDAGYYLPADALDCVLCPANSYCGGGTYTFNETVTQGIVSCGAGLYTPAGMSSANQCGRILHIGENVVYLHSTKKTTPALHVDIDNDGVADYFGNMTTLDVPMTRGTERKLKLQYDGVTYSVYDDSVDLTQYSE